MDSKTTELLDVFDLADLRFFLLIAKKNIKFILFASALVSLIVFLMSLNIEKKYWSEATIVRAPDENKIVDINEAYSTRITTSRINNIIAILKSDEVISHIVDDEKNQLEFKSLYSKVEKNVFSRIFTKKIIIDKKYIKSILTQNFKVINLTDSDVLVLTFISNNPKISQLALTNIISSYQRYEVDSKIQTTNYANIKVKERLKELKVQMALADKNLAKYKKEHNLVDTGNVKELKIKEIQTISKNILDSKQEIQEHENDLIAVKTANGDTDILLAIKDLNERKEIVNIKNNLSANENNIHSLLLIYTEKHPKVVQAYELDKSLKHQLDHILEEVIQRKIFELSNLKSFIELSNENLENAKKELRDIEEKESGMLNFSREVESSRKLYETFLQRQKETNEAQNLQISKVKIIEKPNLPTEPFSPKPFKNFMSALIASLFGFYSLVLFRNMNSTVINTPEALDHLGISQVGVLPKIANIKKGYHILQNFLEDSESNFSEAIRSSRTIIEAKFERNKSFLITSSNPSEGKTSYAFNLALSLERNYKVLFVEGDIRRPSVLNSFYKFEKTIPGLGEIISSNAGFRDTIFNVPGTKLEIITSGAKRFDMSDIVSKEQVKKFFDVLKMEYDYLIIDSPPVQPVSDTLILTQAADYNFFIIRSDSSKTIAFMSSMKKIKNVGAKIDGIIINDLDTSKDSYYNYNYNYNYSSGYYNKV